VKALVTGAGGQVGEALVKLAPEGWSVNGLARAELDITDDVAVRRALEATAPDIVFNAAAYNAVDKAEDNEASAFAVNAEGVRHLAEAARAAGAQMVHISSDYVFDGKAGAPYAPGALRNPLSAYGRSKAAGEDAAGEGALVVRTSWVFAACHANFVTTMLRLMRERDELDVVADQIGAPTWASGLASTLWALALKGATGTWHHRDAGQSTWHEFADAIGEEAEALGLISRQVPLRAVTTAEFGARAPRPAFSLLDDSATRALLGDSVPHWRENLRTMLKEIKARG
jgi:dTDP-4-dehydrorhamnose reductase